MKKKDIELLIETAGVLQENQRPAQIVPKKSHGLPAAPKKRLSISWAGLILGNRNDFDQHKEEG